MSAIAARNVSRHYGQLTVLDAIDLEVGEGEFVSLLGPSGCGKTTLLRILGGFDQPSAGAVLLSGRDVTDEPPERRPINTVFQRGALFPHLTVAENIAYPLRRAKVDTRETGRRVEEMLSLIRLPGFGHRKPAQLSGGQAQRVALARALVGRPRVLLLDEPFSALDLALRRELQLELKRIHRDLACAFVFVTHDQEEALVLSDRIVIMSEGRILQQGSPMSIYREPANVFAARFIGETNLLAGTVKAVGETASTIEIGGRTIEMGRDASLAIGDAILVSIRPESVALHRTGGAGIEGVVDEIVYAGSRWRVRVACEPIPQPIWAELPATSAFDGIARGDRISLVLDTRDSRLLPAH